MSARDFSWASDRDASGAVTMGYYAPKPSIRLSVELEEKTKQQAKLAADLQRSLAMEALWPEVFSDPRNPSSAWVRTPLSQPNPRFILRVRASIGGQWVQRDFEPEQYEPFMSVPEDIVQRDREERRK